MHRRPVAWSCPRLFTAILCSTALQITVSKIYSECRTMQLGLFSRFQDSLTPVHWYGRGEEADRQINVLIKRSTQNFFSRLRKSQMAELIGKNNSCTLWMDVVIQDIEICWGVSEGCKCKICLSSDGNIDVSHSVVRYRLYVSNKRSAVISFTVTTCLKCEAVIHGNISYT